MHRHELIVVRTFGIRLDPGESFFPALAEFCARHEIRGDDFETPPGAACR